MSTSNDNKIGLFLLGISLALGMIITGAILSRAIEKIKAGDQTISVKGLAEKNITSDLGYWSANISVFGSDMLTGYNKLQTDVNSLVVYLVSKGIPREMITTSSINTNTRFRYQDDRPTNEVIGYTLHQMVSISSKNVKQIETISQDATSLIQNGINIESNPPQYHYTKINDLKIDMLGKATKDAKVRAEQIASNSGSTVGGIKSASQGVFQITSINSTEVSDWGENDISSMYKTIKAVVTVEFYIK